MITMAKYITAKTWHNRRRRGATPPIDHVRTKCWAATIILAPDNTVESIQEILLKLAANDPSFGCCVSEKDGKVLAAIYWSKAKTGQWVMQQLDGTGAHIEPAIDAQTLTRYIHKS